MIQGATLKFLRDLEKNNNKAWFDANRNRYTDAKEDFEQFVSSLLARHGKKDPDIAELTPKQCTFRINRDVRFSKNKSPYKNNMGASLSRGGKKSGFAGYYFHLQPGASFIGGGLWSPEPADVKKIRQEIDYCRDEFKGLIAGKKFKSYYGDLYKDEEISLVKVPQGFEKDNPAAEYLRLKSWIAQKSIPDKALSSKELLGICAEGLLALQPLLGFLNRALHD
ncbi:MAG: DUF2461 domain-containing protein [Flavitalea sp.]